jgi:hypothetical protein
MKSSTLCGLLVSVFLLSSAAWAEPRRTRPAEDPPSSDENPDASPKAGTCRYIAPRLKECYVVGKSASIEVTISEISSLSVQIDGVVVRGVSAAKQKYIEWRYAGPNAFFTAKTASLPPGLSATILSPEVNVTLQFSYRAENDIQLRVVRLDRDAAEEEIGRRVAAVRAELQKSYEQKEAALDRRARKLARQELLRAVAAGPSSLRPARGRTISRNDFIVLRAGDVLRIGPHRLFYLDLEADNRGNEALQIESLRAWREVDGKPVELVPHEWQCDSTRLGPGERAGCVLGLTLPAKPGSHDTVRIELASPGRRRHVVLGGIDVR